MTMPLNQYDKGIYSFTEAMNFIFETVFFANLMILLMFVSIAARLRWDSLVRRLMRLSARFMLKIRCGRRKSEMIEIGNEWQRMFLKGIQEIIEVNDDTVYARTHVWCPLRGTGDVHACYRLMEYDRTLLETIGGQIIVLRSQAERGVTICEIAIRRLDKSTDDLIPANKQ